MLKRIVDDHMFTAPGAVSPHVCRLQVFVEANHRPVVLATQTSTELKTQSLTNGAERFAQTAWRTHLPAHAEPPMWIEHYEGGPDDADDWAEVTFSHDGLNHLSSPGWRFTDRAEVEAIVGMPVDPSRGDRYEPPEPDEPWQPRFEFVAVSELPAPRPFRVPNCMPVTKGWLSRLRRQVFPVRRPSGDCCWYHGGDWQEVAKLLDEEIRRVTLDLPVLAGDQDLWAVVEGITEHTVEGSWLRQAAMSVLERPMRADQNGWTNGQHRARAMLDDGVHQALFEVS